MAILEISRLHQFWYNNSDFLTSKLLILLIFQLLDQASLILVKNQIIKNKEVDRIVYLSEQSLHFFPSNHEILVHHFLQISPLLYIRICIESDNMPDLLQSEHIMHSIIFLVKSNTSLSLANSGLMATGEAGSQLYNFILMNIAQSFLISGMPFHHFWLSLCHYKKRL